MKIREVNYYVEDSKVGDEVLLLLHGFTGRNQNFFPLVEELSHIRVIALDMLGHGKSDSPAEPSRYEMEEIVQDIIEILNVLKIDKANVLGYSMGGRVALSLAVLHPNRVAKLILESSSPGLETAEARDARKAADVRLAKEILNDGIQAFVAKWENISLFSSQKRLSEEKRNQIRQQRLGNNPVGLANSLIGMGTGAQPSWWAALSELHMPVLLVCGELDEKFCEIAKRMENSLPNAKMIEIKNAGHAIHVEQPRIFGKIVNEFLNETLF
ncbi:2-succinyl-6-hydroxy-2,4-cyclohexadiene-1-carboxylate synthase [Metabacillus malikii]|uniref:Putative 2-succinyl-6-hydroxy-2,4-cyclohexadiene-1-carboxylate synthase n=2 Tax=Metabacillus malikii TaxID=1504265 RepID=A0ABT9ZGK0_9BACI|nr:2-succinyl-6-hydroxy-2,4-cyclohexadiene-1-carboxylate synthase [Metabacillus malikii]